MSRETYRLTPETSKILEGNCPAIAEELDKNQSGVYAIMAGTATDPFAKFLPLFKACVRLGFPVELWLNKLNAYHTKYNNKLPELSIFEFLAKKIECDAQTTSELTESLKDGTLDDREAAKIQIAINNERKALDNLESHVQLHRK